MEKSDSSKKTKILNNPLVSILYHNQVIDLNLILKTLTSKNSYDILIVLDGLKNIYDQKNIQKKFKNLKIIPNKKIGISKCRNLSIDFAIKNKKDLLIFLDSDAVPSTQFFLDHLDNHNFYPEFPIQGGPIIPTFLQKHSKNKDYFAKIDGMMSWFVMMRENKPSTIKKPLHIPTLNMSLRIDILKEYNIRFNEKLKTGEDIDFCQKFRSNNFKILKNIKPTVDHSDRQGFKEVLKHQISWGRHQYYTVFKKRFNKFGVIFKLAFLTFFPFFLFLYSLLTSLIVIAPWIKKKKKYLLDFPLIYLLSLIKALYCYLEFLDEFKKK